MQRARARNVSERVAPHVAVVGGIRQLANADAIKDNPDHAREVLSALPHWWLRDDSPISRPPKTKLDKLSPRSKRRSSIERARCCCRNLGAHADSRRNQALSSIE